MFKLSPEEEESALERRAFQADRGAWTQARGRKEAGTLEEED